MTGKLKRMSFRIHHILMATLVVSASLAIVGSGSQFVMNAFCTFTIWLLSLGLVGLFVSGKEPMKLFAAGVAFCGWIYVLIAFQSWDDRLKYFLISSALAHMSRVWAVPRINSAFLSDNYEVLTISLHFMCSFFLALAGGYAARWFFAEQRRDESPLDAEPEHANNPSVG